MFKIYDGRENFFQWDINQKLIISDDTITEVHFCNRTDECSLVCEVYEEDGLKIVDVPNVLLQTSWDIRVYAYCNDCYTKQSTRFKVNARSKPADYVYTETEIKSYVALEKRIEELEENGGGGASSDDKMDKFGEVLITEDEETELKYTTLEVPDFFTINTDAILTLNGNMIDLNPTCGMIYCSGAVLTNMGEPQSGGDAATKNYVDNLAGDVSTALDEIIELQNSIIGE